MDADTNTLPKSHKGLLREDLLFLRHIFNLHLGRSQGLDQTCVLNLGRNLPGSMIKDVLMISLDIEGFPDQFSKDEAQHQFGLCILDTRHLSQISEIQYESILDTQHFCIGPEKYLKAWKSRKFCFGEPKNITISDLRNEIQTIISGRDIVLILHGGKDDLLFLKSVDVDFRPLYIVDTQKAAQHPLQLDYRCSMEAMLTLLDCPFEPRMLHNAGNDANFTLRALLLIAAVDAKNHGDLDYDAEALVSAFETIGREYVPVQAFRKREHNRAQNRRHRKNVYKKECRQKHGKTLRLKDSSTNKI
jgi:hypothetical protein